MGKYEEEVKRRLGVLPWHVKEGLRRIRAAWGMSPGPKEKLPPIEYTDKEIAAAMERIEADPERAGRLREAVKHSIWRELATYAARFVPKYRGEPLWTEAYLRLTDWWTTAGRRVREAIERGGATFTGMLLEAGKVRRHVWQVDRKRAEREARRIAYSLDEPAGEVCGEEEADGTEPTRHEVVADPRAVDPLARTLAREELEAADLTPQERQVAALLGRGYRQTEIAHALGITPAAVSQVMARLKAKLSR